MSSSCIEDTCMQKNPWYPIVREILSIADIEINGSRPFDIQIINANFFKRVLQEGSLALGESYMDGWWECERLDIFFQHILHARLDKKSPYHVKDILRIALARLTNLQSKKRSLIVGREHYDLNKNLFTQMLDSNMQYSCAYWKNASTLEQAQENKLRMICEKLQLSPGMTLLDIGCGWGGLAVFAARHYGVSVYGVTISAEQQKLASQRSHGMNVRIILQDYRDLYDQFDRIISVGMFEHVGPKNYRTYFEVVKRNLKLDGLFLLHTIGANRTKFNVDPWINKYIFPNGCLPSINQIAQASEGYFVMEDWHNFGADYDRTLITWFERFHTAWPTLSAHYSPRFKRMFTYYLNACAGAFRVRDIQLWQILFSPSGVEGGIQVPR